MASEKKLNLLYDLVVDELIRKIRAGDAVAADLAVARGFLNDHGITELPTKGSKVLELTGDDAEQDGTGQVFPFPSARTG